MTQVFKPATHIQIFAKCIDATPPTNFEPTMWVKKDRIYKVKYIAEPLNVTEGEAITITNNDGIEITPSESIGAFRSDRFECFEIILN